MPDDLSLLDQLEEWLEAQVPSNLQDLPYRMLETMERVSNELFETLNIHGPSSISIPFPPFLTKEPPPPPPPTFLYRIQDKAGRLIKAHPYAVGAGAALALTVGLGAGARIYQRGSRRVTMKGVVVNGMLKEAIVILAPSPMPSMLWPLAVCLLKAGYIVIIAVPDVEDAESLEKRLSPLEQKSALRVLIYDPDEPKTFPAFERSLHATLTLRFPSSAAGPNDPYNPLPSQTPRIHAYVSLYPLHPNPPSQPSPLPALPTLLARNANDIHHPKLITVYPSSSVLVQPDSFASQILTANHQLLGRNLQAANGGKVISVYLGDLSLPSLASLLANTSLTVKPRLIASIRNARGLNKLYVMRDRFIQGFMDLHNRIVGRIGLGTPTQTFENFENRFLDIVRNGRSRNFFLGQYSFLPLFLSRSFPLPVLSRLLPVLPMLPSATGPTGDGYPLKPIRTVERDRKVASTTAKSTENIGRLGASMREDPKSGSEKGKNSAESSDFESDKGEGEGDLMGSIHTSSGESGEGGLDGSWVGLDATS